MSWSAARHALAAALAASLAPPALAAEGVLWEQTFRVEMEGMAMPGRTQQVCVAEGGAPEPTAGPDGNCQVKDVRRTGNRTTWKVVCTGKDAMTGEGDMTHSADAWNGTVSLRSADGAMKMAVRGRRLGGKCEVGAASARMERQAADARRQSEAAHAQASVAICDAAVSSLDVSFVTGKDALCEDRTALGRLCARIDTREGFIQLRERDEAFRRRTLEACKKDLEAARRRLCKVAMDEAPGKEAVDFLGAHCAEEVGQLAKRECAGRDFTGLDREWVPFCSRHASHLMAAESAKKDAKKTAKDAAVDKGKKAIKGLFGF